MIRRNPIVMEDLERIGHETATLYEDLSNRTILITGANGFLPAYLVDTLLYLNDSKGLGIRIICCVRNLKKAQFRFGQDLERDDVRVIEQDVSMPLSWEGPIDYVFHAASQASPKYFGSDPVGTARPNILGTYFLLELAFKKKAKSFLFFSSAEVYGCPEGLEMPVAEARFGPLDPTVVRSCYAEGKRMGETLCISWLHQFNVPVRIVRPFHVYGPGMDLNDGRVFCDFVANVLRGEDIQLKSDGFARRAYCYLGDATVAFLLALTRGKAGAAYNVGNPLAEVSVLELAQIIAGVWPEKGTRVTRSQRSEESGYLPSSVQRITPDISRMQELGWAPRTGISEGFARTLRSYL